MRLPLACLAAGLAAIALPSTALASVSITSFKVTPSTTAAGAHPDLTVDTSFSLNPSTDDVKALGVVLPQGLVGDPNAADRCPEAKFSADACPASSKVGTTTSSASVVVVPGVVEVPQDVNGDVYNLQPHGSEPARLGVVLRPQAVGAISLPKIFLESPVSVGPDTDYGLATLFDNLPRSSGGLDIRLNSMKLVLNAKAAHGTFLTNPTDCRPAKTTASAHSYDEPNVARTASSTFTPTDCDKLAFSPHLAGSMGGQGTTASATSPTLITAITVDPGGANPSSVAVTLPSSVGVNLHSSIAACPAQQFTAGTCPPASVVGSARALSPLMPTALTGPVRLILAPGSGSLALAVQLGPPVPLTLIGTVGLGAALSNTFSGIPDLPLSRFELTVDGGGSNHLLANTFDLCQPTAPRTAHAQIVAHSGATANLAGDFAVVGCQPSNPGSTITQSGGEGRPTASLSLRFKHGRGTLSAKLRAGRSAPGLTRARLTLPKSLRTGARKGKLPRRLRVSVGKRRLGRGGVKLRGHTLDVRLGKRTARTVSVRWSRIQPTRKLARRLRHRPRLTFVARLADATPRTTRLRLTVRPGLLR